MTTVTRVAHRHLTALASGTKQEADQWKADLRRMTKIYKSIPAADEDKQLPLFKEARALFAGFRENFKDWVYSRLLPPLEKDTQTWDEKQVREKAWTAVISLGDLFPSQWNHRTDLHEEAPWALKSKIEKNIRRYQRAFTDAFKAIDGYLEDQKRRGKEQVTSSPRFEKHLVAGIQVLIDNFGREGDADLEEDIGDFLGQLDKFSKRIVRAGFADALKGLNVYVAFTESDTLKSPGLTAGKYLAVKDSIEIYPLGFIRSDGGTFTHEVGHRFWFKHLSSQARERWTQMFEARTQAITADDVEEFVKTYLEKNSRLWQGDLEKLVERDESDPSQRAKFLELVRFSRPLNIKNDDIPELREWLLKAGVGNKVHIEKISEYATENPIESFAEAFRVFIVQGPAALGPWTRWFFKEVARSGGAKMAHRVAQRFLAAS